MKSAILIPDKIVVGYSKSSSNDVKKAYISFINDKNKVNKESKFEQYVESKESINNDPISGFSVYREEKTYVNDYTEGRSYISLFDPRGFIVKISVSNYIEICLSTDINKGEINGSFKYAFIKGYPILINIESSEYKESLNRQDEMLPVNADSVVIGQRYCLKRDAKKNKNPDKYIYLGKHNYHEILEYVNNVLAHSSHYITDNDKGEKHIFMLDGKDRYGKTVFKSFMPNSLLTIDNSDYIDENVDNYIDQYLATREHNGLKIKYTNKNIETKIENNKIQQNDFVGFINDKVYFVFSKSDYSGKDIVKFTISVFNKKDFDDRILISKVLNNYIDPKTYNNYNQLYQRYAEENKIFESCVDDSFFVHLMKIQHKLKSWNNKKDDQYKKLKDYFYTEKSFYINKNDNIEKMYQLLKENNFKTFIYE